jgi:hypothetical protein
VIDGADGVAGLAFDVTIITGTNVAPSSAGSVSRPARAALRHANRC